MHLLSFWSDVSLQDVLRPDHVLDPNQHFIELERGLNHLVEQGLTLGVVASLVEEVLPGPIKERPEGQLEAEAFAQLTALEQVMQGHKTLTDHLQEVGHVFSMLSEGTPPAVQLLSQRDVRVITTRRSRNCVCQEVHSLDDHANLCVHTGQTRIEPEHVHRATSVPKLSLIIANKNRKSSPLPKPEFLAIIRTTMAPNAINFMTGASASESSSPSQSAPPESQPKRRRPALFLLLALVGFGLLFGYLWLNHVLSSPGDDVRSRVTLEPKKPQNLLKKISLLAFNHDDTGADLAGAKDDRINVLLLGMGGAGHDGPYLTDTIMIASIKPSTKQIALISIPRDLGVSIPGYGQQKINHVNAYGELKQPDWGGAAATELISKTFDLDIPYYIRLDFKAFEEIIDELGGVKVTVDQAFTDPMFPAPNSEYQTVTFKAGEQTLDGKTALTFARSRHGNNGEGSDFARARRQQKILTALKDQITDVGVIANPITVTNILTDLESHLTTNMEFSELVSLARLGKSIGTENVNSMVLDTSPNGFLVNYFSDGGAFMLAPKTGNFIAINSAIKNVFTPVGAQVASNPTESETTGIKNILTPKKGTAILTPNIEIQNGTWNAGLAARVRRRLEFRDLVITTIGNYSNKPLNQSRIYVNKGVSQTLVDSLVDELKIPSISEMPKNIPFATSTNVLIVLGDDFID